MLALGEKSRLCWALPIQSCDTLLAYKSDYKIGYRTKRTGLGLNVGKIFVQHVVVLDVYISKDKEIQSIAWKGYSEFDSK